MAQVTLQEYNDNDVIVRSQKMKKIYFQPDISIQILMAHYLPIPKGFLRKGLTKYLAAYSVLDRERESCQNRERYNMKGNIKKDKQSVERKQGAKE